MKAVIDFNETFNILKNLSLHSDKHGIDSDEFNKFIIVTEGKLGELLCDHSGVEIGDIDYRLVSRYDCKKLGAYLFTVRDDVGINLGYIVDEWMRLWA